MLAYLSNWCSGSAVSRAVPQLLKLPPQIHTIRILDNEAMHAFAEFVFITALGATTSDFFSAAPPLCDRRICARVLYKYAFSSRL